MTESLLEKMRRKVRETVQDQTAIPAYIRDNLKHPLRYWQEEALARLICYNLCCEDKEHHLMFNMATGSGKTLLMAASMLYYYKEKGFRKFIFLVNQNNVLDKTEHNFVNKNHAKYLFNKRIAIDHKELRIKAVDKFTSSSRDIEIIFTTIQKLYNNIHTEKENEETLNELQAHEIVLLADEAHHLNASTRKESQADFLHERLGAGASAKQIERLGWEHAVIHLLLRKGGCVNSGKHNVLLEFTATVPSNQGVKDKYKDKTIYEFGLKEFLEAGHTKDVSLLISSAGKRQRMLMSLIFNWYRHHVATTNAITQGGKKISFKPVILFKSATIKQSHEDLNEFRDLVDTLRDAEIDKVLSLESSRERKEGPVFDDEMSRIKQIQQFISQKSITARDIRLYIQANFKKENTIITNSGSAGSGSKEKTSAEDESKLNSLEDNNNHIRAIFTVNRLVEGWDVLNLYDIVRLEGHSTRIADLAGRRSYSSTISDKQLIGRGVRYCPFDYGDFLSDMRKFDSDVNNELRMLEELYYHCSNDRNYISELKKELSEDGYLKSNIGYCDFKIKESFKASKPYKELAIWVNDKKANPARKKQCFDKTIADGWEDSIFVEGAFIEDGRLVQGENDGIGKGQVLSIDLKNINAHLFWKAINILSAGEDSPYSYRRLCEDMEIESVDELRLDKYLGDFSMRIRTDVAEIDDLPKRRLLGVLVSFIERVLREVRKEVRPYVGTEFSARAMRDFILEKRKKIDKTKLNYQVACSDFYVLDHFAGTSEEKSLVDFIQDSIHGLKKRYQEVFLLRNEEFIKIYNFSDGKGFQPDFILFLVNRGSDNVCYQIFIEPKGGQFAVDGTFRKGQEAWKEGFLEEITQKYNATVPLTIENHQYKLIGLPFYNSKLIRRFREAWKKHAE